MQVELEDVNLGILELEDLKLESDLGTGICVSALEMLTDVSYLPIYILLVHTYICSSYWHPWTFECHDQLCKILEHFSVQILNPK